MVTHLLLIVLCLGVLRTVPGCAVAPAASGTSASGGGTEDETWQDGQQRGRQDEMYHPWNCPVMCGSLCGIGE
jgi:hypothetical protein